MRLGKIPLGWDLNFIYIKVIFSRQQLKIFISFCKNSFNNPCFLNAEIEAKVSGNVHQCVRIWNHNIAEKLWTLSRHNEILGNSTIQHLAKKKKGKFAQVSSEFQSITVPSPRSLTCFYLGFADDIVEKVFTPFKREAGQTIDSVNSVVGTAVAMEIH